jgi:pimeloyl-ACP methyl ester carboxylesterase
MVRPGQTRTYVFVPGVPGGPATWTSLIPFAPDTASLVYWPLERWQVNDPESPDELARLEGAFRTEVEALPGPVTLVGHSFGCWLIARLLPSLNAETTRAVLFGGMAKISAEQQTAYRQACTELSGGRVSAEQFTATAQTLLLDGATCSATDRDRLGELVKVMGLPRIASLLGLVSHLANPRFHLAAHSVPTEVVHLQNDGAIPVVAANELVKPGDQAHLTVWPGGSHMPHWACPEAAARLVFLR